jgi:hypothetical protein
MADVCVITSYNRAGTGNVLFEEEEEEEEEEVILFSEYTCCL